LLLLVAEVVTLIQAPQVPEAETITLEETQQQGLQVAAVEPEEQQLTLTLDSTEETVLTGLPLVSRVTEEEEVSLREQGFLLHRDKTPEVKEEEASAVTAKMFQTLAVVAAEAATAAVLVVVWITHLVSDKLEQVEVATVELLT